jgi:hypothetical protein
LGAGSNPEAGVRNSRGNDTSSVMVSSRHSAAQEMHQMAERPILTVKFLEHCESGELVRAFFLQNGQWGIVGYQEANHRRKVVVVISGKNAPFLIEDTENVSACLSYGKDYALLPEFGGACEVLSAKGVLNDAATLIYACPVGRDGTTERYLMATTGKGTRVAFSLDQFKVFGEPGGNRAIFKQWSIWMMLPLRPDRPTKIFEYGEA